MKKRRTLKIIGIMLLIILMSMFMVYSFGDNVGEYGYVNLMNLTGANIMDYIINELRVEGNITAQNVFLPQYIYSHNNETIPLLGASQWTNITFAQEESHIKLGISHTYNDVTNTTFNIGADGVYYVSLDVDAIDTSLSASNIDVATRAIYTNGTELDGSVFEGDIFKHDIETEIYHDFLVELKAGDKIVFQFIAQDSDVKISTHGTFGEHPDSVTLIIQKIANLP